MKQHGKAGLYFLGWLFLLQLAGELPVLGVLAAFSAVPMYGLRFLFQWPGVYAVSALLSFCWLVLAGTAPRK